MAMTTETAEAGLGLTAEELRRISEWAETRTFPKDAVILPAGGRNGLLYIIREGRVKMFVVDPDGSETVIGLRGGGEYFGSLEFRIEPFPYSAMAVEASQVILFRQADLRTLLIGDTLFADRIVKTLMYQAEARRHQLFEVKQHMSAISEILQAISRSPTDVQSVLETVAENAGRLCEVTNAEILLVEGDELRLVTKHGMNKIWPLGIKIPINRNWVVGRAVADRTAVHVHDLQASESEFPNGAGYAKQFGHRTVFATPMLIEGTAIGVILIRRMEVKPLTENQIELLGTFADQAAIAIQNVRLFNEAREKSRQLKRQAKELAEWNATLETRVAAQINQLEHFAKLEHEISLASEIQKSMLPRSIPLFDGYEFCAHMIPAKLVGGDFFDFIPMGSELLGIAVGDVSDKGVAAALFMAMVRSLLRAEAHPGKSPTEVLQGVNRHLREMNDKEMFATVLYGFLNRATHEFQYARAGHEAPILIGRTGSVKRLPTAHGQALGVFDAISLDEQTVALNGGCTLLLYSDGIPDATNQRKESFGITRIFEVLSRTPQSPIHNVCDGLIHAVTAHQAGSLQHDDMTVVLMRAV
ncbi:MAG: SpoIIE family protein phosphatase [Desulfobacterales bacterium]